MPIADTDIQHRLSGGAANTNPNASLGGAMSTAGGGLITTDTLNNDMDDITSSEAGAGIIIYHGYYFKNNHGTLVYLDPKFWIASQTTSATTDVAVAVAGEDVNTAIETVASETTAPVGETFSQPASFGAGIACGAIGDGDLDVAEYRGHWIRYTVNAGTTAVLDAYTISVQGDSNP